MNSTYPTLQPIQVSSLASEQSHQRLKAAVISSTKGASLFTEPQEQYLLEQYMRGRLTIDEVVYSLEARAAFGSYK